jgi:hypothetical protein
MPVGFNTSGSPVVRLARSVACVALVLGAATPSFAQGTARYDERYIEAGDPPLPWRGSAKDDGYPEPVPPPAAGYQEPPRGSYKDDGRDVPPERHYRKQSAQCLTKPQLREALNDQGWHRFDAVDYRGSTARMIADNGRGRSFDVQFDSCTGEVYEARPLVDYVEPLPPPVIYRERPFYHHGHGYGRYAYGDYGYRHGYAPPRPRVGVHVYGNWR